jgi:methionyl-tRNA formyltransferase
MKILLLCATDRGYRFLKKLHQLLPKTELIVASFKEEPHEPRYVDRIRQYTKSIKGQFFLTKTLNHQTLQSLLKNKKIDLALVVSWRYLISPQIYNQPKFGTYVFHDSLLPEYRGFSPTVWAIINGEKQTGVTLFKIAQDVDSGKIVDQKSIPIKLTDDIAMVMEKATLSYLKILHKNIKKLLSHKIKLSKQDHTWASFTCKRLPEDNQINWSQSSKIIYNLIRAVTNPYPGAFTFLNGKKLIIWQAQMIPNYKKYVGRVPGRVVEIKPKKGSVVLTGDRAILITKAQSVKGKPVSADQVLNSFSQTLR